VKRDMVDALLTQQDLRLTSHLSTITAPLLCGHHPCLFLQTTLPVSHLHFSPVYHTRYLYLLVAHGNLRDDQRIHAILVST